ncbi:MAG: helix-turn-helix domain containing protein [Mycobacterium kyogaense]|uniref:TetR/AcrR family transcriptional regulator n=1 Tax=Mycobacterium kyogaense TaxID=2212479 RepID=UPI002FF5ACE9
MADDSGGGGGFTNHERIRDAALELFSKRGASSVTLRDVADTAGVSVGLVQHYFGSKDRLIEAIDGHVLTVVATGLSAPLPESAPRAVDELGLRVHALIAKHLREVDYFAQMIVTHSAAGSAFFDAMVEIIRSHWQNVADSSAHGADLDVTWAALNPLTLALGAVILRRHIDRQLPTPFTSEAQLTRWETAVNRLISRGQLPD